MGNVPPLKVIVGSTVLPAGDEEMVRTFYDASASLCAWLVREEPEAFAKLIRAVTSGEMGGNPMARIRLFEQMVGKMESIEKRWHGAERARRGI